MAKPILSAFADEYKTAFDGQIEGLTSFGINNIEVRFIDGVNIAAVTPEALKAAKKKLDDAKIKVSALYLPLKLTVRRYRYLKLDMRVFILYLSAKIRNDSLTERKR